MPAVFPLPTPATFIDLPRDWIWACVHSRVHWVGSVINPIDSLNKLEYHFNLLCVVIVFYHNLYLIGAVWGVNYQAGIHSVWECVLGQCLIIWLIPLRGHTSHIFLKSFSVAHTRSYTPTHKSLEAIIVFCSLKNCCESSHKSDHFSKPAPKTRDALFCFADWMYSYLKNRDVE